ncbi:MAG: RHS repeat-associated core domain-containing protein [Planctomycetaceae bacterium]|nr:RHS repeat-associated core domain-containing protein [Planctomycetales bacterium]MCB9872712.1 RHS repeat-associated core domain-containing protein [Planctomycetaceae bacterium]MCB9926199.1 RHS repeat-associated core domain-containing protein [Planctomycetaceae bacterium]
MASTIREGYAADGTTVVLRETTSFDYDQTGIRVSSHNKYEKMNPATGVLEVRHELDSEYLVEHRNFTGFEQVLRETTTDANGYVVRKVVYTLGHDVVSQWSSGGINTYTDPYDENDPNPGRELYAPNGSFLFMYDGHGSVRSILPRGDVIPQSENIDLSRLKSFTYDAYGNALGFNPTYAGTSILYSGEQYDARIQQQYLRARYYDAVSGTFNRLDPFAGNTQDPQSLHKYAYVHGDPVQGVDPTGLMTVSSLLSGISSMGRGIAVRSGPALRVLKRAQFTLGGITLASVHFAVLQQRNPNIPLASGVLSGFQLGLALDMTPNWTRRLEALKWGAISYGLELIIQGLKPGSIRLYPGGPIDPIVQADLFHSFAEGTFDAALDGYLEAKLNVPGWSNGANAFYAGAFTWGRGFVQRALNSDVTFNSDKAAAAALVEGILTALTNTSGGNILGTRLPNAVKKRAGFLTKVAAEIVGNPAKLVDATDEIAELFVDLIAGQAASELVPSDE